jgi:hypothetical protein
MYSAKWIRDIIVQISPRIGVISMPVVEKLLIFLASPGDVQTERRSVEQVVEELNRTVATEKGLVLQVVRWENDAFPGYGTDAQALINEQIAAMAKYTLFVGIMWNRLGMPTPRAESGTVEEFERAVQARAQSGQPEIWFYFRQAAAKFDTPDQLDQRKKVLALKEQVQAKGLPWTYKSPSEFRDKFRNQMILWLNARAIQTLKHDVEQQALTIRAISVALRGIVTRFEIDYLRRLINPDPWHCRYDPDTYDRLKRLDDLGFVLPTVIDGDRRLIRIQERFGDEGKPVEQRTWFNMKDYVEITEAGRDYVRLYDASSEDA